MNVYYTSSSKKKLLDVIKYLYCVISAISIIILVIYCSFLLPTITVLIVERPVLAPANNNSLINSIDLNFVRWDTKRKYQINDNIFIGETYIELSQIYNVCLATHSSLERLETFNKVLEQWTGPISISLFAFDNEQVNLILVYLEYLKSCYSIGRKPLVFHLVTPKIHFDYKKYYQTTATIDETCPEPKKFLAYLLKYRSEKSRKWYLKNPYPQNHLRNLARKNCQCDNVFSTDIDIIPSYGAAENLNDFLRTAVCTKPGKCVYVVPTYELSTNVVAFPNNKSELVALVKKQLAWPLHEKVFQLSQYATNSTRWESFEDSKSVETTISISHPVPRFKFSWEPYYIASDTVPQHDERFLGYGYTRSTQVYETYAAGYKFFILSPVFCIQWGLQTAKSNDSWRIRQEQFNLYKMFSFRRELYAKYKNRIRD